MSVDSRHIFRLLKEQTPDFVYGLERAARRGPVLSVLSKPQLTEKLPFLGPDMLLWTWQRDPFDPAILGAMSSMLQSVANPPASLSSLIAGLAAASRLVDDPASLAEAVAVDPASAVRLIAPLLRNIETAPAVLSACWNSALYSQQPDTARLLLEAGVYGGLYAPLLARLRAEFAFVHEGPERGLHLLSPVDDDCFAWWKQYLTAECLLRTGENEEGLHRLRRLCERLPWHVNLRLKLRALHNPEPVKKRLEPEDAAVLLYTWNKCELLERTLASLADSDIGGCRVIALDNGSDDATQDVLQRMKDHFAKDRFTSLRLPVNIGAPAARNWLLGLPEALNCRRVAFLDDDVVLPPDWLQRLCGAAESQPNAGAVGCRIVSAGRPVMLQSADINLLPMRRLLGAACESDDNQAEELPLLDNVGGGFDDGLLAYNRPCLSVSGCCHLVNMKAVRSVGGFDIRFSPSQFDDIDRDMRSFEAGFPAFYLGDLVVRHAGFSGMKQSLDPAAAGQVRGNRIKLAAKYEIERRERTAEQGLALLWRDFLQDEQQR